MPDLHIELKLFFFLVLKPPGKLKANLKNIPKEGIKGSTIFSNNSPRINDPEIQIKTSETSNNPSIFNRNILNQSRLNDSPDKHKVMHMINYYLIEQ